MNTKKLLALITVICLLVCVAIPVAAAPGERVMPEYNEELMGYELVCDGSTNIISVPAGEMPNISMTVGSSVGFFAMDAEGNPGAYTVYYAPMQVVTADADGNATAEFPTGQGCVFNTSEVDLTFYIIVTEPVGGGEAGGPTVGTRDNPIVLTELGAYTATAIEVNNPMTGMTYGEATHYKWTADSTGLLMLAVDKNNAAGWSYCVNNLTTGIYGEIKLSDSDCHIYLMPVTEGDEVMFNVGTAWCNPGESIDFTVAMIAEPDGTFNTAEELTNAQVTVPAGTTFIYTINSMLNGMELTVEGGTYTLNNYMSGTELSETPVNILMLVNDTDADATYTLNAGYPIGSEGNPIVVTTPADLTVANVNMFQEVWYAVSSRLDGYTLTVTGEGVYVIVNGTQYDAVDGVVTVTLEAKSAMIPVVIGNNNWLNTEFACTWAAPDTTNPETSDFALIAIGSLMAMSCAAVVLLKKKEN